MSELMKTIEGVKCSDVFDSTKVRFPFSWSDKMVLVGGRAIRNYDRLTEENQRLTAIATKHATRADELYEALGSLLDASTRDITEDELHLACEIAKKIYEKSRVEAEQENG